MLVVELAKWGTMIGPSEGARVVFADDVEAAQRAREKAGVAQLCENYDALAAGQM
jgi:hypothetical protein